MALTSILYKGASASAGNATEDSCPHRDSLTQRQRGGSSLGFDLDVLGGVVHNPDANVVVVEVLLDLAHDVAHHLLSVLTRNRGLRDGVEKCQMLGAALLLGEQASIFHGHAELDGGG